MGCPVRQGLAGFVMQYLPTKRLNLAIYPQRRPSREHQCRQATWSRRTLVYCNTLYLNTRYYSILSNIHYIILDHVVVYCSRHLQERVHLESVDAVKRHGPRERRSDAFHGGSGPWRRRRQRVAVIPAAAARRSGAWFGRSIHRRCSRWHTGKHLVIRCKKQISLRCPQGAALIDLGER